jgi:hypothetical protein
MILGTFLSEFNYESVLLLEGKQYGNRYESSITLEIISLRISGTPDYRSSGITDLWLINPRLAPPDNCAIKEKSRPNRHATCKGGQKLWHPF